MPKNGDLENNKKTETTIKKQKSSTSKIKNEKKNMEIKIKKEQNDIEKDGKIKSSKKVTKTVLDQKKEKREFRTLEVSILVLLTCIISLVVGGALGIKFHKKTVTLGDLSAVDLELREFIKDYNYLIQNYYGDLDKKELLNTAFKSMVDTLDDTYSGTISEDESNNFDIKLEGSYEGLGIEIVNDENMNILIYSIIPNSPASKTDLRKGDKLISVNGTSVSGMKTLDFINNLIKSSKEAEFSIIYEREGEEKNVLLSKSGIVLDSVTSKIYDEGNKKIGYLKVSIFALNTYEQFKKELNNLMYEGIDSLIIDLRDNSGGHLTSVRDMIGLFLDSSHVIYQMVDNKKTVKVYSSGKETKKYPIVLLGNSSSASASEVMISALTEEYGAILVGNKTFGKGTVQELHKLSNGDEYKFTTKKWLTPSGKWVHKQGIEPKLETTLGQTYYENPTDENDNQLRVALEYLKSLR